MVQCEEQQKWKMMTRMEREVVGGLPGPGYLFAASFRGCDLVCGSTCYAGF
jgi:hypothetical protein